MTREEFVSLKLGDRVAFQLTRLPARKRDTIYLAGEVGATYFKVGGEPKIVIDLDSDQSTYIVYLSQCEWLKHQAGLGDDNGDWMLAYVMVLVGLVAFVTLGWLLIGCPRAGKADQCRPDTYCARVVP